MSIAKFKKVIKRDGSLADFDINQISESIYRAAVEVGGRDRELSKLVANEVIFLLNRSIGDDFPSTEEINDLIEKALIERGHAKTAKQFILFRAKALTYDKRQMKAQMIGTIPYQKIWNVFVWNHSMKCETIAKLNEIVKSGSEKYGEFAQKCDKAYEEDIQTAASRIINRGDDIRLVIVAGPSSSGKTTSTIKLEESLQKEGKSLKAINVDNYFFDLELHPKDAYGDYDFETPMAIDIKLFNEHLNGLIAGKEILTPFYDFKNGKRIDNQTPMHLEENEIILLDCLHGLYPPLTNGIPEEQKVRLYIETLGQQRDETGYFIRWTDIRLLRRMVRDQQFRGYKAEETLTHWHYVRRSEMQYIIPHIGGNIDYIINGALAYELPIHKYYLGDNFEGWANKYKEDNDRKDAFIRAERIFNLMNELEPITEEHLDQISKTSLMREYIGGSSYSY